MLNLIFNPFRLIISKVFGVEKPTVTELFLIAYMALITCDNSPLFLYGGYAIVMVLLLYRTCNHNFKLSREAVILLLFVCYCGFSIIWAWDKDLVLSKIRFLFVLVLFAIVISNYLIQTKNFELIFITLAVMGIALSIYVIISNGGFAAYYEAASAEKARLGAEINNTNVIGSHCAFASVILLYYILTKKRMLCIPFLILTFLTTVSSGSKKALALLLLGGIAIVLFSQYGKKGFQKYIVLCGLIILSIVAIIYLPQLPIFNTVLNRFDMFKSSMEGGRHADGSTIMRQRLIEVGWEQFKKTPILGIGLDNARKLNGMEIGFYSYSHNDYIEQLVNGGLVGFLLYYGVIGTFLKTQVKVIIHNKHDVVVVVAFILMLMMLISNIAVVTYYHDMYIYLLIALCIAITKTWKPQIE